MQYEIIFKSDRMFMLYLPRALAGLRGALGCAHNGGGDRMAALAGVRCSGLGSGLCAKVSSAEG
jgi:hypothetical protein